MSLIKLAEKWEDYARNYFLKAAHPMYLEQKEQLEEIAMLSYLFADELREIIGVPLPSPLVSLKEKIEKMRKQA